MFNCACINTYIPLHCLHAVMNVKGRNFFHNEELDNGTLFEPDILRASILTGNESGLWILWDQGYVWWS